MINENDIFRNNSHLRLLQNQREPAWLWDTQQHLILWTNLAGLIFWDETDLSRLKKRRFDHSMPALMRLTELSDTSLPEEGVRETLLFWTPQGPKVMECLCNNLTLENGSGGILLQGLPKKEHKSQHQNISGQVPTSFKSPLLQDSKAQNPSPQDQEALREIAEMMADPNLLEDLKDPASLTGDSDIDEIPSDQNITLHSNQAHVLNGGGSRHTKQSETSHKTSVQIQEQTQPSQQLSALVHHENSVFFAKISHEVRTPLNSIIGFAEIMKEGHFGPIENEKYKGYIIDIFDSAHLALSLINDLLDLSKIEAGQFKVNPEKIDLNSTIEKCISSLQPQASKGRLIFRLSLKAALPKVLFDHRNLKQVLLNVLANAIKATPPGGQVIISTALDDEDMLHLKIRDTGIGMSPSDLAMALQPFKQVENPEDLANTSSYGTGQGTGQGTGLGLPLTKALVEANKARFQISSTPGKGTLVEILFPKPLIDRAVSKDHHVP